MSVLLLEQRQTPDSNQIWREAIKRGHSTMRVAMNDDLTYVDNILGYYGNAMTAQSLRNSLLCFPQINPYVITEWVPYLGRSMICLPFNRITQPIREDTFMKCVGNKWIEPRVYRKGEIVAGAPLPDDLLYLSDIVKFKCEVRCFVWAGDILTASQYRLDGAFAPETYEANARMREIASEVGKQLPKGVVIDFGLIGDEWYIVEFNEAWASGLYECDPSKAFDVILASQYVQ